MINSEWIRSEVEAAFKRIGGKVETTPLVRSRWLSEAAGAEVYCKLENFQYTGSFKYRGALNKILSLGGSDLKKGVITASTGNHALAVARALQITGSKGIIFVPENIEPSKMHRIGKYGVEIRKYGTDNVETEIYARSRAKDKDMTYISPYNDRSIIAGQGTIGVELEIESSDIDALFASVGGGGLISGVAGYLKGAGKDPLIKGCSPVNSPVMARSVDAGEIIDMISLPTLSDGTAGGLEPGAITFDTCRELVDSFVMVTEDEIRSAILGFLDNHRILIEGAAAVSVASLIKAGRELSGGKVIVIICGGNIGLGRLREII